MYVLLFEVELNYGSNEC